MHFFDEIKSYVGFTDADAARLRELGPCVDGHFESLVEQFYTALNANERTKIVFDGPAQVERLRRTLQVWLAEVFAGPYDQHYFLKRKRIGEVHVEVGLLPHFMFGAMNILRRGLLVAAAEECPEFTSDHAESIEKILDIELTVMVQTYWDELMRTRLQVPAAMAAGLAHEIRNPLNTINLHLTLMERRLRKSGDDSERLMTSIEGMRQELIRLRGLTSEIVDFTKPIQLRPSWVNAAELLAELRTSHGPLLEASGIEFETRLDGGEHIWCDRERLVQALVNLLSNSAEALEERGGGGKISISIENQPIGTVIDFSDNGPGMPPGLKYRVFDLFFTTKASGTGLGLPIVQHIVVGHGGTIDVASRQNAGTLFTIHLPNPRSAITTVGEDVVVASQEGAEGS